jgi:hypothetical protein
MPIRILLLLICFLWFSFAEAQKNDPVLEKQLQALISGFKGDMGIYVHNLKNHRQVAINADTIFPTASIIKIPILTGIMRKIEYGQLTYHQPLIYKDSLLYEGEDILGSFKNNEKIASIGATGYMDYEKYKKIDLDLSKKKRTNYKKRHEKDRHIIGSNGFFADKILWN